MSLVWVYASRIDQCELLSWSDIDLVLLQESCPCSFSPCPYYMGNKYGKMYYSLGLPVVVFNLYEGNEGRSSALRDDVGGRCRVSFPPERSTVREWRLA